VQLKKRKPKKHTYRKDDNHKKLRIIHSKKLQRIVSIHCKKQMCNKPVCDYKRDNNVLKKLLKSTKGSTLNRIMSLLRKNTQVVSLMGSKIDEDFNYWKIRPPPKRKKKSK
jgi:hypothetical protein